MSQTVIGFFDDASDVQRAVERLERKGISRDRIDVSSGHSSDSVTYGTDTVSNDRTTSDGRTVDREGRNTNAITDFFNSLFGGKDDDDADRYSRVAQRSNSIVTVHAQNKDDAEAAAEILDDCGAIDVDERASHYGYTNTRTEGIGERSNVSGDRSDSIERIEENLEVGKKTVETGAVRVRSRIVERPVEENIRLREEHVRVERNPVDRPVSGDELGRLQDREIEMRESTEVPVVNKEARVVEEIRLSKDVDEKEETIRENVRHTEVDVDDDIDRGNRNRNSLNTDEDYDDDIRPNRGL